jgi:hypothetical protein
MSTVLWLALAPDGDVWFTEWSMNKIGVVPADRPIPISLIPSQKSLKFESGAGTTVTLTVKKNQQGSPNGVFDYTWGTYSPDDISVSFSPQNPSFAGMSDVNVEAKIGVIPNTKPGNYTLGLGVDLGDIRVWSMLQTQVLPTTATLAQIPMTTLAISALVFGGLGILVIVVRLRKRSSKSANSS